MQQVVAKLSVGDMIDLIAYVSSVAPQNRNP
jgi:hypothetical protein